jgi:hypothetical protein
MPEVVSEPLVGHLIERSAAAIAVAVRSLDAAMPERAAARNYAALHDAIRAPGSSASDT